ncbi:MAG: PQQ-binding-like beta-propeller repeat protein [Chloroflexi bacterium]|nr:PQQ-binding-like beta-propeller repeat protein [Chloroflexota bacterium]MBU1661371.1 PQQ-binding-like beta-propeller repeat protein [Chloroflexota bacterium]
MKTKHYLLIFILLALAAASSACTGNRMVASGWAGVTADEDTAYLAFNNHVIAIDLDNGNQRWQYPAEPDTKVTFYAAPVLTGDGQIIVGGYDNVLYSLNPANGQVNWTFKEAQGRYIGSPLVTETGIYAPSTDKKLYALDFSGSPIWNEPFQTDEPLWARPSTDSECDCVYLASMDHLVYAIDAQSGDELWRTADLGGAIVSTPIISADHVLYIGTFANQLVALNADTGGELWRFATQDWVWASPALDGDTLYFGDLSGKFYAVDRNNGQVNWQIQPDGSIVGMPLVTEDGIYFTTEEGSLISVTTDGAIRWNQSFDESLHAGPVAAGDLILVASSQPENLLIAIDANGVQKWSFGLEK